MADFLMPSLGADMEAGKLVEWLVKPGDHVKRGDIVAVVETEKAEIEVEIFTDGVVLELTVPEGQSVPIGSVLAKIGADGEVAPVVEPVVAAEPAAAAESVAPVVEPVVAPAEPHVEKGQHVSPVVRRVAERLGVDLASVPGTGRGGSITRADVERAAKPPPSAPEPAVPSGRIRVSPLAASRAQELGVDLSTVTATGAQGAITRTDVERAAGERNGKRQVVTTAPTEAPERAKRAAVWTPERQLAMRDAIANLMARSKREIPHYYLGTHVDMSSALEWLQQANEGRAAAERLLPATLLMKAAALAVHAVPEMNGFWTDDAFVAGDGVHLGVAISLRQGGLIAPCIHDADAMTLDELMVAMRDLIRRARAGQLRSSEMSDSTIT
ncbi:MAG: dihydrolipoamide acetyltransferase family protein, partial [Actinomycetota bacterium]